MAEFSLWMEGYQVTGNKDEARLVGTVEADIFAQACAELMSKPPWNDDPSLFNWRLLVCALAAETLLAATLWGIDTNIAARQTEIIAGRMARRVSPEQRAAIVGLLTPVPKGKVLINAVFEGESLQFADDIADTLKAAGFEPSEVPFGERAFAFTRPGASIWVKDLKNQPKHAGAIWEAFKRQGIVFGGVEHPEIEDQNAVIIAVSTHP